MIYGNTSSRSFIDLCPKSLRFNIFLFRKNNSAFEASFHTDPPRDVGMKIYSNVLGRMTKMASRPICGKNQSPSSEPRGR